MASQTERAHQGLIGGVIQGAQARVKSVKEGYQRCFHTLWGRENEITWETMPNQDLIGSVVPGSGRKDWIPIRPFDLLPEIGAGGGFESARVYEGEAVRINASHIVGPQPHFERAGDFDTIFFQFAGYGLVETSFGRIEMEPGEALLIPAMVAHRTVGSVHCRRMEYRVRDLVDVRLDPSKTQSTNHFRAYPEGQRVADETVPALQPPATGRIREHLTRWDDAPGDDYLFERTYEALVGQADSGRAPIKIRPFDHLQTNAATSGSVPAVRTAQLWDSQTFRQQVFNNPGRQPAPHVGYDEDELWFQLIGPIDMETEHAAYTMQSGASSMAEAGIAHTGVSNLNLYRLTTYSPRPMRLVVTPEQQLRETRWVVEKL